jgi:hypothetical protein
MNIDEDLLGGISFKHTHLQKASDVWYVRADLTTESCIQLAIKHLW